MKILTLDIETTGLPPKGAKYDVDFLEFPRIVSIAWKINDEPAEAHIVNLEGFEIPQDAIDIHGITNEMVRQSKHILVRVLGNLAITAKGAEIVIGHGLYFDTSTIKANILREMGGNMESQAYVDFTELLHKDKRVDTMQKTVKFCGLGKYPKLQELYQHLFNEEFGAHDNKKDVEATYKCYKKLVEMEII